MSVGEPFYDEESLRLRQEYEALPKTPAHGAETELPHPNIRPEWVMRIIDAPNDQWEEIARGEVRSILVGCVAQFNQWIVVVFIGDTNAGVFHTAYADRRLERRYGGRPWRNAQ